MKMTDLIYLSNKYGRNTTLGDILKESEYQYKCLKRHGTGTNSVKYDAYPKGLPDSGWATDIRTKHVTCDLCYGQGYTKEEFKTIKETVITGYEKV